MLRLLTVLTLLAAAGGAAAQPDETPDWRKSKGVFCTALDEALAAAREPEPFASLRVQVLGRPDTSRLTIPGFEDHACSVRRGSLYCTQTLAPPHLTLEALTADTARCLGQQPEELEGFQVFELDNQVAIQIESECNDACHVGRRMTYRIEVPY